MNGKKETPRMASFRLYKKHKGYVKKIARKFRVSQAQVVRDAIEQYAGSIPDLFV